MATYFVRPEVTANYKFYPIGLLIPVVVFASLSTIVWAIPKGKDRLAFVASSLYITGMLVGAAFALYPIVLPARQPQFNLTIANTAAGSHGLAVGLYWWLLGMILAVIYFVFIYRMFRGKVQMDAEGY
jgi:cytochrome d ubiquinol oxidase subunit II